MRAHTKIGCSLVAYLVASAIGGCMPDSTSTPPESAPDYTDGVSNDALQDEVEYTQAMLRSGAIDYGRVLAAAHQHGLIRGDFNCGQTSANGLPSGTVAGPFVGSWMHPDSSAVSQASSLGITSCVGMVMAGTLSQPVTFTGALTTTGRAVMARYATAAGVSALADSPLPGPGDVLAAAILIVGVAHVLYEATVAVTLTRPLVNRCAACPPPPPPSARLDTVPPSRPHWPCTGSHTHAYTYYYNQNPITCACFLGQNETITCH